MASHLGKEKDVPASTASRETRHIKKLMTIAENPRTITRSLKNGKTDTVSLLPITALLASILLKKINNKNEILHIKVNLEKNEINFIN